MLDELTLDDATATDNCGEVTIEVSSEETAGDCEGSYTLTRVLPQNDAGNSVSDLTIMLRTTAPEQHPSRTLLSALTSRPLTTPLPPTTAAM